MLALQGVFMNGLRAPKRLVSNPRVAHQNQGPCNPILAEPSVPNIINFSFSLDRFANSLLLRTGASMEPAGARPARLVIIDTISFYPNH
jgi:hypothetical protein